jgi:hypothetical protein
LPPLAPGIAWNPGRRLTRRGVQQKRLQFGRVWLPYSKGFAKYAGLVAAARVRWAQAVVNEFAEI